MKSATNIAPAFVVVIFASAFGTGPQAPPSAVPKQGHFSFGAEYVFSRLDVKTDEAFFGPLRIPPAKIRNVDINRVFFVPSLGVFDNLTLVGRLGANKLSVDAGSNKDNLGGQQGSSDWDFTAGAGAKAVLYKQGRFSWGISGLFTWTDLKGFTPWTIDFAGTPVTGTMKLALYDYQFQTGPAYEVLDGWTISAGPYAQFIQGRAKIQAPVAGQTVRSTIDVEQDNALGGYISSQMLLGKNLGWNLRFSTTGTGYTIGTSLTLLF